MARLDPTEGDRRGGLIEAAAGGPAGQVRPAATPGAPAGPRVGGGLPRHMLILGALSAAQAADPDLNDAARVAFLEWHCSPSNVSRRELPFPLVSTADAAEQGSNPMGRASVALVGTDGLVRPVPEDYTDIAVAADAPVSVVAAAFAELAHLGPWRHVYVLTAPRGSFAPRPLPPRAEEVLARLEEARAAAADPDATWSEIDERWAVAMGSCSLNLLPAADSCSAHGAGLVRVLREPRCHADEVEALALFALAHGSKTEGTPIARHAVAMAGTPVDAFGAEGTWGDVAGAFLASPDAGLDRRASPVTPPPLKVDSKDLVVWTRVRPEYPAAASVLRLGVGVCLATVRIDEKGAPVDIRVDGCQEAFRWAVIEAMRGWRWRPVTDGGRTIRVQTTYEVTVKP